MQSRFKSGLEYQLTYMIKTNIVSVYRSKDIFLNFDERENWYRDRFEVFEFTTSKKGTKAAQEAFVITNAPEEILTKSQKQILKENNFKGPSLSVGDIVRISSKLTQDLPEYYLCKSHGWEKFEGNRIQLLKHLTW